MQQERKVCRWRALVLSVLLAGCAAQAPASLRPAQAPLCAVFFSPNGGCTEEVVHAIGAAKDRILVQAYSFTSEPIAQALIAAHRRGVRVEVLLDRSQATDRRSSAARLAGAGVPLEIDRAHAIAHNKVIVIDGETVLTGSFNFTESAERRNAENLLVLQDRALAEQYAANWASHRVHSQPYRP